jgi:hypothetical protein
MIIMYGPGSLVTRQRPTLAAARLLEDYVVPFAVITNGKDALIMDTASGKVIGEGLESIPDKQQIQKKMAYVALQRISDISGKRKDLTWMLTQQNVPSIHVHCNV